MRLALGCLLLLAACAGEVQESRAVIQVGAIDVDVAVARTAEARGRGLQGVVTLPPNEGMLLLYRSAGTRSIWMKHCRIDLDVAFLDDAGRVIQLVTLKAPASEGEMPQRIASRRPARMVLEMNAGWFARNGLGLGTTVTIPAGLNVRDADP